MAVYQPPDNNDSSPSTDNKKHLTTNERFYVRPSLGLKLWGPLVPASDNRQGIWTLVGIQTTIGVFCLYKFRKLVRTPFFLQPKQAIAKGTQFFNNVKNIADIPTLNRFSTTHKVVIMENVPTPTSTLGIATAAKAAANASNSSSGSNSDSSSGNKRFGLFRKVFYLITGTMLLSQSLLEFCRLKVLKYDPWYEEAKTAREKKFFNDIVKFYHEDIDPTKVKVKDAMSGNIMSTNIPEVKQSVALVRAQAESENPIVKWYGPIEFKPMSFSDYLDRLEYYLQMNEMVHQKNKFIENVDPSDKMSPSAGVSLLSLISHTNQEYKDIVDKNERFRESIRNDKSILVEIGDTSEENTDALKSNVPNQTKKSTGVSLIPMRGITLDPKLTDSDSVDIDEVWTLYDPWMNLGLDTSLSIKFIPTVVNLTDNQEIKEDGQTIESESDSKDNDTKDKDK